MLRAIPNSIRALRLLRTQQAAFSTKGDPNSTRTDSEKEPQPKNPEQKENDFEDEHKKKEQKEEEYYEEPEETPKSRVFRTVKRVVWWTTLGYLSYNYYQLSNDENAYQRADTNKYFLDAAKYVERKRTGMIDFFTKPPVDKLLPDMPDLPFIDTPKTLVLNLSDTLIHSNYEFGKGREIIKRPGLTEFLRHLSRMYEIVVLTDDDRHFAQSICMKLDPQNQMIAAQLGNESHIHENSMSVKDLRYLNRDLKKVVVVEISPERMKYQPENAVIINKFTGDVDDKTLYELLPLLEHLARPEVRDVRNELKRFGLEDPAKKFLDELRAKKEAISKKGGMGGLFRGMQKSQQKSPQTASHLVGKRD